MAPLIPADRKSEERDFIPLFTGGAQILHRDTIRLTKTGDPINVSVHASPIFNNRGDLVGVAKFSRNVSVDKAREVTLVHLFQCLSSIFSIFPSQAELLAAKRLAETANVAKSAFLVMSLLSFFPFSFSQYVFLCSLSFV